MTIKTFDLGEIGTPPKTLTYKGKKYSFLLDSKDFASISERMDMIIKAGSHYPRLVTYTLKPSTKNKVTPIYYALYVNKRVR